ncbi:ExeM/NucH family extracellular endonuclease [Saccharophagus degradans]|uniref:ExeM/NucH family extracellular endonuclease n=1 Tax=Saccharophagus degradans TaxID=86304 RepID=UPI001C09E738|nr:ExeM/NucH family extracellular endonuclease [Saccharophagus degradans]MBU2984701.1 ExeM/NucH family extracellular endonuclease [Saccharophagus degradans]
MKKTLMALLLGLTPLATQANVIITAVYDGPITGGVPKGVELYVADDVADLSVYGLGSASNGGGTDGEEFTFPAVSVSAGEYLYVASEAVQFEAFFGFAPDYTSSAMSINGDDAIELFQHGALYDVFGVQTQDGTGTEWDYLDGWAYRVTGSEPSTAFNAAEWIFSTPNAWDGETTNATAAVPLPTQQFATGSNGGGEGEGGDGEGETPVIETVFISSIQGNPATYISNQFGEQDVSPLNGTVVQVEAVVVGDFQNNDADTARNLGGFYLQEEAGDEDGNALSSEGVFVYEGNTSLADVNVGDLVKVVATVGQYYGETQLTNVQSIEILAQQQLDLVNVAQVSLLGNSNVTINQDGRYQPNLEAYEGMLVTLVDTVQITEQYQLDRFNEIRVAAGERPVQFSQLNTPDATLYDLWLQEQGARSIVYDDGLNSQNESIDLLDGFAPYTTATAPRMGDTVNNLTGVLDYKWAGNASSGATWRLRSHRDGINHFERSNPRPTAAPSIDGNLKVTSFNVLNFFATIDESGVVTMAGHDPRGADSIAERDRQLAKLTQAILAMDADVVGLVELENEFDNLNDGSTAIEMLVNSVNAAAGETLYDYVYPGSSFVGTDAIAVGVIYKPAVVQLAEGTVPAQLDDSVAQTLPLFAGRDFAANPLFNGVATNRVSLAVSFTHLVSKESFTVVANHFKSKGSSGLTDSSDANFDKNDGAGFWNQRRLEAAQAVVAWLQAAPTGLADSDQIILGDLNAYAAEEPIQYLLAEGFNNVESEHAYSYVFDGQVGTLDYLLVSDSLFEKFTAAQVWNVNADEADAIDYNLDYGRSVSYFDAGAVARNSDHDPVLVGFELTKAAFTLPELAAFFLQEVRAGNISPMHPRKWFSWFSVYSIQSSLNYAVRMNELGRTQVACHMLARVDAVTDNQTRPRDWVKGESVSEFNQKLHATVEQLSCN